MATPKNLTELAQLSPKLAELSQQLLFDDIWARPELSRRERSLVTLAALASLGRWEQLPFHLDLAKEHGLDRSQLAELFTHLAFYAGWPAAVSALGHLEPSPCP